MTGHSADALAYIEECIGPRQVGTLWRDDAGNTIRVLAVDRAPRSGRLWEIVEVDEVGQQVGFVRPHETAWNPDRNRVLSQPGGAE